MNGLDKDEDPSSQNMSAIVNNIYRCISNNLQSLHIGFESMSDDINDKLINLQELCSMGQL